MEGVLDEVKNEEEWMKRNGEREGGGRKGGRGNMNGAREEEKMDQPFSAEATPLVWRGTVPV